MIYINKEVAWCEPRPSLRSISSLMALHIDLEIQITNTNTVSHTTASVQYMNGANRVLWFFFVWCEEWFYQSQNTLDCSDTSSSQTLQMFKANNAAACQQEFTFMLKVITWNIEKTLRRFLHNRAHKEFYLPLVSLLNIKDNLLI